MLERNYLLERLRSGKPALGIWNTVGSSVVTDVLASAGFHFVMLDLEHGIFRPDEINSYVNACERYGCSPIVRLPTKSDWLTLQVLDQGAHGILVAHTDTAADARDIAAHARYAPRGMRGFSPFTKAGGYTNARGGAYAKTANELIAVAALIESKAGLDALDQILEEPGIDIVYFGAFDLSQALGVPGEVKSPKVVGAIRDAVLKVRAKGKFAGGFVAFTQDDVRWQIDLGLTFITFGVDTGLLYQAVRPVTEWFHSI